MSNEPEKAVMEDDSDEKSNIVSFDPTRRAVAPRGGGGNWIRNLSVGTVFIAKPINDKSFMAAEFEIVTKGDFVCLLELHSNEGTAIMWVIQALFCNAFNLIEIIRVP